MREVRQTNIYVGLNDAETHEQLFDTEKYLSILKDVCKNYHVGFSVDQVHGGYFHDDGSYVEETSLVLTLLDTDETIVQEIAKDLCAFFHQESVMVTNAASEMYFVHEHLFDEIPEIKGERVILRKFEPADAQQLEEMTEEEDIYRFEPSFLYERKYADKEQAITEMYEECFRKKESLLLAICKKDRPEELIGIAEFYNYEPEKQKASIGYRLRKGYWDQGYASEICPLMRDYLFNRTDIKKITAHIRADHSISKHVAEKYGFICKWPNQKEDWGFDKPVIADKYICEK